MMRRILFIYILLYTSTFCFAQKNYRFESITVNDGLSQSSITSMVQDKFGFLWIGTQDGLNKYDGHTFKVYRKKDGDSTSLPNNFVTHVFIDQGENLWIVTYAGICKYDPVTDGFINQSFDDIFPKNNAHTEIFYCRDHSLAISTTGGLIFFNPQTGKFFFREEFKLLKGVLAYYETKNMGDWVFAETTLHKPAGQQKWKKVEVTGIPYYNKDTGELFLNDRNRLLKYDASSASWNEFSKLNGNVTPISTGEIWVSNENGVYIHDSSGKFKQHISTYEITSANITLQISTVYETRDGVVWVGTNGYGLKKYNPQTSRFGYVGSSTNSTLQLSHSYVDAIYTSDDSIVYVSTPAGLDILNIQKNTSQHFDIPYRIFGMTQDHDGTMWFSSWGGLYYLKNNHYINSNHYKNTVHKTDILPDGQLLITGRWEIIRKKGNQTTTILSEPHWLISRSLLVGDTLWVGMAPGGSAIKVVDVTSGKLLHDFIHDPTNPTSAPLGGGIKCFFQDSKKNMWIGSNGGGLSLYNPSQNNFTHFTEKDGLPNNVVYGILEDDNQNLWLSTNKGLCEFNPITKKVRNFDVYDGLQSNEFNTGASFKSASGTMYFGGVNGLTYFHPKNIVTSNSIPQSAISGFYVNNNLLKDYSPYVSNDKGKNLPVFNLQYHERDFGFDVVGIGFSLPGRTRYRYMLENYDNQWHNIGNLQHISFTNISPGEYVFKVQSSDPYGNWEEAGASIQVIIQSSIWRNPWVWTVFLCTIGVVIGTTINARIKYSKKRNHEKLLQQENLLRSSIETQEEERKRIAQDLHDELGAILSISRMHIVQLQDQGENANTKIGLQQVRTLTESALSTMRRISHELMPPQLVEFGLTKTLQALITQLNETKKISCSFLPPDENIRLPKSVELGIYRVCMELVNNTLKHACAGHIKIQLTHHQNIVLLTYDDDGMGLPENYTHGHGFKNMAARVNGIGGSFEFGNGKKGGFHATLKLEIKA